MAELEFVVRGRTVKLSDLQKDEELAAVGRKPKRRSEGLKRVELLSQAKESLGLVVAGFSPERLCRAEEAQKVARQNAIAMNRKLSGSDPGRIRIPPEWDARVYMATHRPTRANPKPYFDMEAAEQCAGMLRAQGWLSVTVTEELRG